MIKKARDKKVSIFWEDARIGPFKKGSEILLTPTKCEGELMKRSEKKGFILLKDCKQFVFNGEKEKFILKRKTHFFLIPEGMIRKNMGQKKQFSRISRQGDKNNKK